MTRQFLEIRVARITIQHTGLLRRDQWSFGGNLEGPEQLHQHTYDKEEQGFPRFWQRGSPEPDIRPL